MASEAELKNEIARLTASINQHKSTVNAQPSSSSYKPYSKSNTYVNPNYKPASNKYIRGAPIHQTTRPPAPTSLAKASTTPKEVVLNGVAFQSSSRSLVRKDLPVSTKPPSIAGSSSFARKSGHLVSSSRVHKPTTSRGRGRGRGRARGRRGGNMTLDNNRRPYKSRAEAKRLKYMNKPCPRFTTTGACSRGLTCMYQHDPAKIAICWNFLQGNCPNSADACNLSHDPTPERTPLCVHFVNKGRCHRGEQCPFPHVKLGPRDGICRDFAVLGYCEKGLECDKQHVRECPDFAETGACKTKGCKLPHVIRANRNRPKTAASATASGQPTMAEPIVEDVGSGTVVVSAEALDAATAHLGNAQIGDEFISLTFNESDDEEEEDSDEEGDEDEDEDNENDDEEASGEEHAPHTDAPTADNDSSGAETDDNDALTVHP